MGEGAFNRYRRYVVTGKGFEAQIEHVGLIAVHDR